MVNRKTASVITIATLLATAIPVKSMALSVASPIIGQAAPSFSVPTSVKQGTEVTISSSSDNMNSISEALKESFERDFNNSEVVIENKDANAAIQDVLNGNAELAAISRPLTVEEKEKGLIAVPVRREKIAIVVGEDNPFSQSITGSQFAQIFRGEIKDWSELGGEAGPIRLVDRPAASETRQALSPYPVFTTAPFNATADATTVEADTTEAIVSELGKDGISYVLVGELAGQPEIKALELHKTPPSDPRYPFSQPYSFVYAGGASPAISAFLGYAIGNPGQAAINDAGVSGLGLIPEATNGESTVTSAESNDNSGTVNADTSKTDSVEGTPDAANDNAGTSLEGASTEGVLDGETLEANSLIVPGPNGDINVAGPDGVLGTADDVRLAGPDGEFGTADDVEIAGPDGELGTADDIDLAGPDGEFGTADDLEVEAVVAGTDGIDRVANRGRWWWLLLPLAGLGLLIWAAGKRDSNEETGYAANIDRGDRIRSNFDEDSDLRDGRVSVGGLDNDLSSGGAKRTGLNAASRAAAGGAAIAGGAATGAGLAGRASRQAGDATMDLQEGISGVAKGSSGQVKGGIDGAKGSLQSGIEGIKGKSQSSIDGLRSNAQGHIDGVIKNVQSGVDDLKSNARGSVDNVKGLGAAGLGAAGLGTGLGAGAAAGGLRGNVRGSIDEARNNVQSHIDGAERQINTNKDSMQERFEGAKQAASDNRRDNQSEGSSWLDRAKQRINAATEQVKDEASNVKDDLTNRD